MRDLHWWISGNNIFKSEDIIERSSLNKFIRFNFVVDILFYVEAWKVEGSLILDQASVSRMVTFHERKHETRHCQIHSQGPERKHSRKRFLFKLYKLTEIIYNWQWIDFRSMMKRKIRAAPNLHTFNPAIVVPYSLYKSKHIFGTSSSSICKCSNIYSAKK